MPNSFNDFSDRIEEIHAKAVPSRQPTRNGRRFRLPALPVLSHRWYPVIGALIGFVFILLLVSGHGHPADANVGKLHEEWVTASIPAPSADTPRIQKTRIKSGDNIVAVLQRLDFSRTEAFNIIRAANPSYKLRNIRAGHTMIRTADKDGLHLYYNIDNSQRLHAFRPSGSHTWQAKVETRHFFTRQRFAAGTIHGSLFAAAEKAGLDQRTTMNLVDIFAWDIDFARDLRAGDSFQLLYEERFDDEGRMITTAILAAEFINQGHKFQAVRYTYADGHSSYFTPAGKSMRKAYLKAPVKFSRISSRFTLARKHPILGYTRAHRGVDYAAPRGTPIHAIGDGFIEFIGWRGGYGRYIRIRHNNRSHSTVYAHMSRYARGMKKGKHVHQGEVIGYVGMSGLATGPHLHFEFRIRNRAVNPLTVKHPPAKPIAAKERNRFRQQTAPLLTQFDQPHTHADWG